MKTQFCLGLPFRIRHAGHRDLFVTEAHMDSHGSIVLDEAAEVQRYRHQFVVGVGDPSVLAEYEDNEPVEPYTGRWLTQEVLP